MPPPPLLQPLHKLSRLPLLASGAKVADKAEGKDCKLPDESLLCAEIRSDRAKGKDCALPNEALLCATANLEEATEGGGVGGALRLEMLCS